MDDGAVPATWDVGGLRRAGYSGFVPLLGMDSQGVPRAVGTYMVLRTSAEPPVFLPQRRGEPHPRHGAPYGIEALRSTWQEGSGGPVLYIGKADQPLRKRLAQFQRAGTGGASHEGGRRLWWLADADELIVAWRPLDAAQMWGINPAKRHEDELLIAFMRDHDGAMPWANVEPPSRAARQNQGGETAAPL